MLTWSVSGPVDESPKTVQNAQESWAVLETGNLGDELYHGDDYLDPVSATTIT